MKKIILIVIITAILLVNIYAQQVSNNIRALLSSEGKVFYGEEPNSIVVMDYPENIKRISEYLEAIDVSPAQVLIEARVVEVRLTDQQSLGVNWRLFHSEGAEVGNFKVGSTTAGTVGIPPESLTQLIPYKNTIEPGGTLEETPFTFSIFDENINVVINALANSYNTEVLSAPRVATVNNRPAQIRIVQQLPWAEPTLTTSESGSVQVTWTIHFEDVGIMLQVTPTISENGDILMTLNPEISEKIDDYTLTVASGGVSIPYTVPIIDRRMASTKLVLKSNQTVILGGLMRSRNVKSETKIPLLGDIPLLGNLFKAKLNTKERTELLIFVSPSIINEEKIAQIARQERYGISRNFVREREEEEIRILEREKKEMDKANKLAVKWNELLKKQELLINQTKKLQEAVNMEEERIKQLEKEKNTLKGEKSFN
ncbi:MAG: hypothetical protein N2606_00855 [Candidatus Omnitrophica bacterium]|nr:hypothetical protein [Candidatus Omnitrophota bacterium]